MICATETRIGYGSEIAVGTFVLTADGEPGEVSGIAFGVAAVRILGGAIVYCGVGDVTPVRCPADVVSSEEAEALHRAA